MKNPLGFGVLHDSVNPDDIKIEDLTPDERANLEKSMAAYSKLLDREIVAKYKIEVLFDKRKTNRGGAFPGIMIVWRSGSALNGDGDELLFPCPKQGCQGYLLPENINGRFGYCGVCGKSWNTQDLKDARIYNLTPAKWATVITREFLRTGGNADVYMKTADQSLHRGTEKELEEKKHGANLYAARASRNWVIYALARILKDTSTGASVESRIEALLRS